MMDKQYQELIELGKYLFDLRYTKGSAGNLSMRLASGEIIATPTNSCLGMLKAEKLSILTSDGSHLEGNPPTKEIPFHLAIYEQNPNWNAIIHLHSPYLTALSCLKGLDPKNVIRPFVPYVIMRVGDVPLIPYFKPGSIKIADAVRTIAHQYSAFLLANHGVIVCGRNLKDACYNFEELEEAARLFFILKHHDIRYLNDTEIQELKKGV